MRIVACDSETWLIAPGRQAPSPVCWTFTENGQDAVIYNREEGLDRFEHEISRRDTILAGHWFPYDCSVAIAARPRLLEPVFTAFEEGRARCTQIREMLDKIAIGEFQHDPDENYKPAAFNLATCVGRRFGVDISEDKQPDSWRTKYWTLDNLHVSRWPIDAIEYALNDARWAWRLFNIQSSGGYYVHDAPVPTLIDEVPQTQYAFALYLMQCWGLRASKTRHAKLKAELLERCEAAYRKLLPLGIVRFKKEKGETKIAAVQSVLKSWVEKLYIQEGKAPPRTDPTKYKSERNREKYPDGQISISTDSLSTTSCRDVFGRILCVGDPGRCNDETGEQCENPLHWYSEISEDRGELSKYVAYLEDATILPVNASIKPLVATGRTAVLRPPWQQLPRRVGIREVLEPRFGTWFIGCDYSANELVTLAQILCDLFGDSELAKIIRSGRDPHLVTAALILGQTYEQAVAGLAEEKSRSKKDTRPKPITDMRQLSKALNFGLPGGMSAAKFVQYAWKSWSVRITEEEAHHYKRLWFDWYPEVSAYQRMVGELCAQGGDSFTLIQPRTGRIRGNVGYCDGCNSQFQGLAADMTKRALWRSQKEAYTNKQSPLYGSRGVIFNHDEIIKESPWSLAPYAADRLSQIMVQTGQELCPDVPVTAEAWVSVVWSKEVKPIRGADGLLRVWSAEAADAAKAMAKAQGGKMEAHYDTAFSNWREHYFNALAEESQSTQQYQHVSVNYGG